MTAPIAADHGKPAVFRQSKRRVRHDRGKVGLAALARRLDEQAFARAAGARAPLADPWLRRLSRAADHGVLWLGTAAALAATGRRGRRAAARGVVSLGAASALVNGPAKWAFRRGRPSLLDVPPARLLTRQPHTSSFPSGHSASAAAFATGVSLELGPAAAPLVAAAAAVAYSRVHTGVHYPGDVLAGVAIGIGAATLVRRNWPLRTDVEPAAAAAAPAPALPDGDGLVVVVNDDAGNGADDVAAAIADVLPAAEVSTAAPGRLEQTLRTAARNASALGVCGGDGSVCAAVEVALAERLPLAVLPGGTLNHFAVDLGVDDASAAAAAVGAGSAVAVSVGTVDDGTATLPFANTFSVGLYPDVVAQRERWQRYLGKWLSLTLALVRVLHHAEPLPVTVDGESRRVWLLFAGNGRYDAAGFAPGRRRRLDEDVLDVRIVNADHWFSRTRIVAAVIAGRLAGCRAYDERVTDRLVLTVPPGTTIARDGEAGEGPTRFELRPAEHRLVVYRPGDA